ncbi:498_t:CDS:2 [Diversispora eburnea]|uniref:498_t:CDS:1 n=1 Tax=Diversispora eburnea TaxID=1213867 RepID=A0A9N8YLQ0_9GLOM|nr:498_t:CDS:2 [Diversispora eburnea]
MNEDDLGFLPPMHFRPKNPLSLPPSRRSLSKKSKYSNKSRSSKSYNKSKSNPSSSNQVDGDNNERKNSLGQFQRLMNGFMFGRKSVNSTSSSLMPQMQSYVEETILGEEKSQFSRLGSFQRSLNSSQLGIKSIEPTSDDVSNNVLVQTERRPIEDCQFVCEKTKSVKRQRTLEKDQINVDYPNETNEVVSRKQQSFSTTRHTTTMRSLRPSIMRYVMERNTLRRIRPEINKREIINKVPGPIEFLPSMDPIQIRTCEQDRATLNNVMEIYQNQKSLDNKSPELFKSSNISEEEWISILDTIFLYYRERISVTIGKIVKFDLDKRIITIADCTGEIQVIFHEKVHQVYSQQLQIGTIIVLQNLAFLRVGGNNYLNVTLDNVHWMSGKIVDRNYEIDSNTKVLSYQDDNEIIERVQLNDNINVNIHNVTTITSEITSSKAASIEEKNFSCVFSNMGDHGDLSWMLDDLDELCKN